MFHFLISYCKFYSKNKSERKCTDEQTSPQYFTVSSCELAEFTRRALLQVELEQSSAAAWVMPSLWRSALWPKRPCAFYVKPLGLTIGKTCFLALFTS